jgi:hypothetical protein
MRLPQSLATWGTAGFAAVFKAELEAIPAAALGLQQAADWPLQNEVPVQVSLLSAKTEGFVIQMCVGVFFTETIAGCACGDAPLERQAYAELDVFIDCATAAATVELRG